MLRLLLAQAGVDPFKPPPMAGQPSKILGLTVRDALLIFGAGLALALLLFLWAYLRRKKHRHRDEFGSPIITKAEKHNPSARHRVRKRRRNHPENLPRNPTLGETGGLPPVRPEEPTEPTQ